MTRIMIIMIHHFTDRSLSDGLDRIIGFLVSIAIYILCVIVFCLSCQPTPDGAFELNGLVVIGSVGWILASGIMTVSIMPMSDAGIESSPAIMAFITVGSAMFAFWLNHKLS